MCNIAGASVKWQALNVSQYFSIIVSNVASLFLSEIEMLADDVLGSAAPDSEGCSGAGQCSVVTSWSQHRKHSLRALHTVHYSPDHRPGMTTGAVENVNKSCGQESREQWTLHLVVTLDLSTLYSVLTTYNLVELSEAGTCLYALGLKIQVIEFLGGQY